MEPAVRIDELELLHAARYVNQLRLIEHRKGMMRQGGRGQQRCGDAGETESCPRHDPLRDIGTADNTTDAINEECRK